MDRGNKGRPLWLLWDARILTVAIGTVGSGEGNLCFHVGEI